MSQLLAIAAGGAVGSMLRFGVSNWVYGRLGAGFPWGTLTVNVLGSLLIGLLYVFLIERSAADSLWRAGLIVGLLGGFTTFSAFSIETLNLLSSGELGRALLNVAASVTLCLLAAWMGVFAGRQL
jgi:CrcB protein